MELSGVIFATGVTGSMNIDRQTNMKPIGFARFWQKMLWETQQIFDNKIRKSAKAITQIWLISVQIVIGLFSVQYNAASTVLSAVAKMEMESHRIIIIMMMTMMMTMQCSTVPQMEMESALNLSNKVLST